MKQYRVMVMHKKFMEGKWTGAVPPHGKNLYKTLDEAKRVLMQEINNCKPTTIEAYSEEEGFYNVLYDDLEIIDSKIEVREVTEWEEI